MYIGCALPVQREDGAVGNRDDGAGAAGVGLGLVDLVFAAAETVAAGEVRRKQDVSNLYTSRTS